MQSVDGDVRLSVRLDNSQVDKDTSEINKQINTNLTEGFKKVNRNLEHIIENFGQLVSLISSINDGINNLASSGLANTNSQLRESISNMREFNEEAASTTTTSVPTSGAGQPTPVSDSNIIGDSLPQQVQAAAQDVTNESEQARSRLDMIRDRIQSIIGNIQQWASRTREVADETSRTNAVGRWDVTGAQLRNAASATLKFASSMLLLRRHTKSSSNTMSKMVKTTLKYVLGIRSFYMLFNKLRQAIKQGFGNLAQYSDETNKNISTISGRLVKLKNSLASAFDPILIAITPALVQLIDLLSNAIFKVGEFIAALNGQKVVHKAVDVQKDYAASLNDSAKAADKLNKSLGAYDKLQVITSQDTANATGSTDTQPKDMFETVDIEPSVQGLVSALKLAISTGNFDVISQALSSKINSALAGIDWEEIKSSSSRIATGVASFINGAITGIDWSNLGKTGAEVVNTVYTSISTFLAEVEWRKLGESVISLISGTFGNYDFKQMGQTLNNFINGIFNFLIGAIQKVNWKNIPNNIASAIGGFFSGIDWKTTLTNAGELIGSALAGAIDLLAALGEVLINIGTDVKDFFVGKFKEAGWEKDAGFINNGKAIITGLKNGIVEAIKGIGTWIKEKIFDPIWTGIKKAFGIASPSKKMKEIGGYLISGLKNGITGGLVGIWKWIKENIFDKIWGGIKNAFGIVKSTSSKMKEIGTNLIVGLKDGVTSKIKDVKDKFKEVWSDIKDVFSLIKVTAYFATVVAGIKAAFTTIPKWFGDKFKNAWQKVKDVFSKGGEIFTDIKDGVLDGLKSVINHLIDGINKVVSIPFNGLNDALDLLREVSIFGAEPFSGIPEISVPKIPKLAQGRVLPPNNPFLAIVGDQRQGTNVETPLSTMIQAFDTALDKRGASSNNPIIIQLPNGKVLAELVWDEEEKRYKQTGSYRPRYS